MSDDFIDVKLSLRNVDTYFIRKSIHTALKRNLKYLFGDLLDVGCGRMPYKNFILENSSVKNYTGLDIETAIDYGGPKPDLVWNGNEMPVQDSKYDCIIATEVFEHCPDPELIIAEIYRVLKPGGVLFFSVPFLWPLHEIPFDEYRYTPFAIKRIISNQNFEEINLQIEGGWDASLAQMIGLWLKRRDKSRLSKGILTILSIPLIKLLLRIDKKPTDPFNYTGMLTGISGIALKK